MADPVLQALRTRCIVCESGEPEEFLDLGETALANGFLRREELSRPQPKYPLRAGFCRACGHVQLMDRVPPAEMFADYLYLSSASETLKDHLWGLSDWVTRRASLSAEDLVIDIGCNDGTLLKGFRRYGVKVLGVDPAKNLADYAKNSGIPRFVGFFNSQTAPQIVRKWGKARIITATNTFPHIPDLADFLEGIQTALAPEGQFVIEAHYLADMLEQRAFDTIYHEHVSYWALGPMTRLFEAHGMQVVYAQRLPIHHGQLRVVVQRKGEGKADPSVGKILERERQRRIGEFETYRLFAEKVQEIKRELKTTLLSLQRQGKKVVGYGAPAKGNTLLGFLEIGPDLLEYIVDKSPLKQGRFTPGHHIPVVPTERLLKDQPDVVLLLAWNFTDEILAQQQEYRRRGGKFILPIPEVRIV